MKTTSEILKQTKLSYPKLEHLKLLGIVPRPKVVGMGRGKGIVGYYGDEVVDIINRVKRLQRQKVTLLKIAERFREERASLRAQVSGELVAPSPSRNSGNVNWAIDQFAELAEKYPDHRYGEITIDEELGDGTVRGSFWLSKKPKND